MERISVVALMAIILGTSGCNCFRRNQTVTTPVAVCPAPAPMCPAPCNPCAPGAVTYGYGSGYTYGVPMQ